MKHRITALVLAGFGLVGGLLFAAPSQAAGPLSGDEIRTSVVGKTIASRSHSGKDYTMALNADGSGVSVFSGSVREPLTWDLKGNVLCFHGPRSGTECNTVTRTASGFDFVDASSGKLNNSYAVR